MLSRLLVSLSHLPENVIEAKAKNSIELSSFQCYRNFCKLVLSLISDGQYNSTISSLV